MPVITELIHDQLWVTYKGYYNKEQAIAAYSLAAKQYQGEFVQVLIVNVIPTRRAISTEDVLEILKTKQQVVPHAARAVLYNRGPVEGLLDAAQATQPGCQFFRADQMDQFARWLMSLYHVRLAQIQIELLEKMIDIHNKNTHRLIERIRDLSLPHRSAKALIDIYNRIATGLSHDHRERSALKDSVKRLACTGCCSHLSTGGAGEAQP